MPYSVWARLPNVRSRCSRINASTLSTSSGTSATSAVAAPSVADPPPRSVACFTCSTRAHNQRHMIRWPWSLCMGLTNDPGSAASPWHHICKLMSLRVGIDTSTPSPLSSRLLAQDPLRQFCCRSSVDVPPPRVIAAGSGSCAASASADSSVSSSPSVTNGTPYHPAIAQHRNG